VVLRVSFFIKVVLRASILKVVLRVSIFMKVVLRGSVMKVVVEWLSR
jgi:hypothetical protein